MSLLGLVLLHRYLKFKFQIQRIVSLRSVVANSQGIFLFPKPKSPRYQTSYLVQFASQVEFSLGHFLWRVLSLWPSKFSHFLVALGLVYKEFSTRKLSIPKTSCLILAFVPTATQVLKLAYLSSIIVWGLDFILVLFLFGIWGLPLLCYSVRYSIKIMFITLSSFSEYHIYHSARSRSFFYWLFSL